MLTSQNDIEEKTVETFENPDSPSLSYPEGPYLMELYVKEDTIKRTNFLLNHHDIVGFLYILVEIVTKTFLVKLFLNFDINIRTVTAISGNCFDVTLFRVSDKILFSYDFDFEHTETNDIFQP